MMFYMSEEEVAIFKGVRYPVSLIDRIGRFMEANGIIQFSQAVRMLLIMGLRGFEKAQGDNAATVSDRTAE